MKIKLKELPDIREIKAEVIEKIVKSVGITKAAFFLRETMFQKTDYLKIKDRLFGEKSSTEIYSEIYEWKKSKKNNEKT